MRQMDDVLSYECRLADPLEVGGMVVQAESKALAMHWKRFGGVWNRPIAILVTEKGVTRRLPIPDVTRRTMSLFLGLGLAGVAVCLSLAFAERIKGSRKWNKI